MLGLTQLSNSEFDCVRKSEAVLFAKYPQAITIYFSEQCICNIPLIENSKSVRHSVKKATQYIYGKAKFSGENRAAVFVLVCLRCSIEASKVKG